MKQEISVMISSILRHVATIDWLIFQEFQGVSRIYNYDSVYEQIGEVNTPDKLQTKIYVGIYQHYNTSTNVIFFQMKHLNVSYKTTTNTRHKDDNVQVFVFALMV